MGSKRAMLGNGLGELLSAEVPAAKRFADLFSGSAAVAIHVACHYNIPVLAFDLQSYSSVLAAAVIKRKMALPSAALFENWRARAEDLIKGIKIPEVSRISIRAVEDCREWCSDQKSLPITVAYGGHYFSPTQAVWIDVLRASLPPSEPEKTVALAALIQAASQCAAAPGHTAQPFQPTPTAKGYLHEAWTRDLVGRTSMILESLAKQKANQIGSAKVSDAEEAARSLKEGDLAFIDPPYSGVHYSRFYHVLETISQGSCGEVSGRGRYPDTQLRPKSRFSLISESTDALNSLLKTVSSRGAQAILTFPDHVCSNGLSGDLVREIASKHFTLRETQVESKFSTLGGTSDRGRQHEAGRSARRHARELMLVLGRKR